MYGTSWVPFRSSGSTPSATTVTSSIGHDSGYVTPLLHDNIPQHIATKRY